MAYASRSGRARTSVNRPRAFSVCDRCGMWYNHYALSYQVEWAGTQLITLQQLVCRTCNDKPNAQLRAIVIPPDPLPIINPRVENFVVGPFAPRPFSMPVDLPLPNGVRLTEAGEVRLTED